MKKRIFKGLYEIVSFFTDSIEIRFLTRYKVLLGTSLLMLTACQLIKKNDQDEGCLLSSDLNDDFRTVSCYLPPIHQDIPEESDLSDENYVHRDVEDMPEFPGGDKEMMEYLIKRIKYPEAALKNGIYGKVVISLIVEKDGRLSEIELLRSVDPDLDKEALRVVRSMPRWRPGRHKGKEVRVKQAVAVPFRLMR